VVISAPQIGIGGFDKGPSDRIAFARPGGKMRDLFDEGVQRLEPKLPIRMNVNRQYELKTECEGEKTQVFRGSDCGNRSARGDLRAWFTPKNLRGSWPFVLGMRWQGVMKAETFDPYRDCIASATDADYPDSRQFRCLQARLNDPRGRPVGAPDYTWVGPREITTIYDYSPGRQTCFTGASPVFDGRALFDCSQKTVTVKQEEDKYSYIDGRADDRNRGGDGFTVTTKIAWEFTLKRVGCGKA
jgi:hypothetical protein